MNVCIVCDFSVFVLFCVQVATLRLADPPSKGSYRLCIGSRNVESCQGPTEASRVIIIIKNRILLLSRIWNWIGHSTTIREASRRMWIEFAKPIKQSL
jgi:hypothetical protein